MLWLIIIEMFLFLLFWPGYDDGGRYGIDDEGVKI